jgi:lipopolysaccharide/colanic/teichoic acid biosynthesis glycosyltransferase
MLIPLIQLTWLNGLLAPGRRGLPPEVRSVADFQRLLKKERMRADRARSMFCLLAMQPTDEGRGGRSMATLARRVVERIRFSDDVGLLKDGRLGIFLPDTPVAGAWKVAQDILATCAHELARPACEVYVYPFGPLWHDNGEISSQGTAGGRQTTKTAVNGTLPHPSTLEAPQHGNGAKPAKSGVLSAERLIVSALPWWKRAIDVMGAAGLFVALLPLLALAALAVKLTSRGPVFFAQERDGLGGRPFRMLKFRTMRDGADEEKHALREHSEQDGPAFKIKNDPRLTLVGRFLRATSIDELPQLWNVVRGEMSLVGPRPLPCDESAACQRWQRRRLEVTPGLTCIWQVSGRNLVAFDEWMRMDLRYVDGRSPWMDLKLLLWTLPAVLSRKGAM